MALARRRAIHIHYHLADEGTAAGAKKAWLRLVCIDCAAALPTPPRATSSCCATSFKTLAEIVQSKKIDDDQMAELLRKKRGEKPK